LLRRHALGWDVHIRETTSGNGDFILAYRAPNGDPIEPKILIDNKDKLVVAESDIDKPVRDSTASAKRRPNQFRLTSPKIDIGLAVLPVYASG
jgi:hypothetical protein